MRIPVDAQQLRMISAGSTVEESREYGELADGTSRWTGNQARLEDGRALWVLYAFVPGDEGTRPEMVKIKVASHEPPETGAFPDVLEFDALTASPYLDRATGRVNVSWRCDGVRVAGRKPQPVAS